MKNNYSPLDNKYIFRRLLHALYMYIASQVSNALVIRNPNSTNINTLCRRQRWLLNVFILVMFGFRITNLKPSILLILYICIRNHHGPNFDLICKYNFKNEHYIYLVSCVRSRAVLDILYIGFNEIKLPGDIFKIITLPLWPSLFLYYTAIR